MTAFDIAIIGAGIAGASAAFAIGGRARVLLLERESQPGYHSTGRSAAVYAETYGNATIRALTTGSRAFFTAPPPGFAEHPILTPRGVLHVGPASATTKLERLAADLGRMVASVRLVGSAEIRGFCPALREDHAAVGIYEPEGMDIDVDALHRGFLRGAGATLVCDAGVTALERRAGSWQIETAAGRFSAPIVINAAGAWADAIAGLAGIAPIPVVPKRRTIFTFDPPAGTDIAAWPMIVDSDEQWYLKPDAGRLLASPADEGEIEACDVQPDEMDLAVAIDRIETATTLSVRRPAAKWAGLRSFAPDRTIVCGFDDRAEGFCWLAGQGGYGIQTAPAMGRVAAAAALGDDLPADLQALGVTAARLGPARFRHRG